MGGGEALPPNVNFDHFFNDLARNDLAGNDLAGMGCDKIRRLFFPVTFRMTKLER